MKREPWDYDEALEEDRGFERRLPLKELFVLFLVAIVLSIRIFLG